MAPYNNNQVSLFLAEGIDLYIQQKITIARVKEGLSYLANHIGKDKLAELYRQQLTACEKKGVPVPQLLYTTYNELLSKVSATEYTQKFKDYYEIYQGRITQKESYAKNMLLKQGEPVYYITQDEYTTQTKTKEGDMRGIDYISPNNRERNYSHMRRILQQLWAMESRAPYQCFEIDTKFQRDADAISKYISDVYTPEQINEAHGRARATYTRGRPKGALNKSRFGTQHSSEFANDLPDIPADINYDATVLNPETETNTEQVKPIPTFGQVSTTDMTPYATKAWVDSTLDNQLYPFRQFNKRQDEVNANHLEQFLGLQAELNKIKAERSRVITIQPLGELPPIELGVQHVNFPTLLTMCRTKYRSGARVMPWVYGPAGTGKSTAAEMVAKALTLDFYTMGKTIAKFEVLGFINTTGYQTTEFRKAYEFGGVFCADEMDAWSVEATIALNGALENGHCAFPDATVKRHADFIMIACANTTGAGATMDFVGRNKQDGATLNRFVPLFWPLDEALEDALCADKGWLALVRSCRQRANTSNINPKPIISPRQAIQGEALLASGLPRDIVIDCVLRRGLTDQQWSMIKVS